MGTYLVSNTKKECCGCGACSAICPKKCISLETDEYGFYYPKVNISNCIQCHLCESVCIYNEQNRFNRINSEFYAGHNSNVDQMMLSSSGGLLPIICEKIIENKGVVFSVTRDNCNVIKYVQIQDKKDIPTIQGSKYVQADTKGIFARIKEALDGNKLVLFSGTPCHVAALKLFLHKDYEKLFTISVICHGVPSQKMFLDYIDYLERKHKGKLIDINFRDKEKNGWSITLSYTIERRKKKKYFVSNKLSPYFIGFLKGMIVRESCHNCLFAGLNHESDIMLGDFWGFKERYAHLKSFFGFSIFSVNTEIGSRIMSMIKMNMEYGPVDTDDVFDSLNTNLKHSTIMDDNYYLLMDDYSKYGFDYIVRKYLKPDHPIKETIKKVLPSPFINFFKAKRRRYPYNEKNKR